MAELAKYMTCGALAKALTAFPPDAPVFAYEGEGIYREQCEKYGIDLDRVSSYLVVELGKDAEGRRRQECIPAPETP